MVATQVTTNVVGTRLHPQTAGTLGVPAVFIFLAAAGVLMASTVTSAIVSEP